MEGLAFWSHFGRRAMLAAAAMSALALGGCSTSRFDFPPFSMTSRNTAPGSQYAGDPMTTGSIPVPPKNVYGNNNAYGRSNYAQASYNNNGNTYYPPAYRKNGAYAANGQYNANGERTYDYGNSYGDYKTPRTARNDLPPPQPRYTPKPTPVSYSPDRPLRAPHRDYSVKQAVYTPIRPAPRNATARSTRVAMADEAQLRGPGSKTITVKSGDSLYLYAIRYHVSVEAIQTANNLTDIRLRAGQKIVIPAPGSTVHNDSYIVRPGDSLSTIADSHHVDEHKLAKVNHITNVHSLQVGQELIIPGDHGTPNVAAKKSNTHEQTAQSTRVHVVHTTTVKAPGLANPKPSKTTIATAKPVTSAKSAKMKPVKAAQGENDDALVSKTSLPSPDPMSGQRFRWPVNGRIISRFGTRADGGHNDGIDLAVPQGTPVKAAENGVVAYAGDELKGYGNLVLIRHANNWVTAYAHNETLLVKRGQKVRRGQIIAKAGATGSVSQPELHFELRKGARPVNPLNYMTTSAASAD